MTVTDRWLLPEGVEELLPPDAWRAESLRRAILNLYRSWGYELIIPPLIEYLESLLTGTGNDLALQTFKVTDQLTGRMMGIRADMTPQAVRIDAHGLRREGVSRLCYAGSVLHTRPANMMTGRSPIQVGCELFGAGTLAADVEIISMMIETLRLAGADSLHLDLSHVGIFRTLADALEVDADQRDLLHDAVARKSVPDLESCLTGFAADARRWWLALVQLCGSCSRLGEAHAAMTGAPAAVFDALDQIASCVQRVNARYPQVTLGFDLAELRGYNYHTGIVFTAYVPGIGRAVAQGGRYDNVGQVFGRSRPATGFSADLKALNQLASGAAASATGRTIFAPEEIDAALEAEVCRLRQADRVIRALGAGENPAELGCTHRLTRGANGWVVEPL